MKEPLDYATRYKILAGRNQFAAAVVQRQLQTTGLRTEYLLSFPNKESSILTTLAVGEVNTTPAEVSRYLSTIADLLTTVPGAPIGLIATELNEHVSIEFTPGLDGGSPITNYEYSLDDGATFTAFSPSVLTSPVLISNLTNDVAYTIRLRAVNALGAGQASASVTATPTGSDTFVDFTTVGTTTWTAPTYTIQVQVLVVAGGGGSGGGFDNGGGGGGGAGEVVSTTFAATGGTTYTIVVGDGGAAGVSIRSPVSETSGGTGDSSSFATIVAVGGSGGFGSRNQTGGSGAGGAQVVAGSGGGAGRGGGAGGGGGGGGGNGSAGGNKSGATPGAAGSGVSNSISGSPVTYGAGGAGAPGNATNAGVAGTANTGNGARAGGGGSAAQQNGAKGGSGYVAIRFSQ